MRKILLTVTIAFGLIATDPAICAQLTPTLLDAAQPSPITTQPPSPEMPSQLLPFVIDRSLPPGPPATNPAAGADSAESGSTSFEMMKPVVSSKTYPLCSRTLQDNCVNPGEAPRTAKKRQ